MEELFGVSMNLIMIVLLTIFLAAMAVVAVLAWRNRVMLKLGLRNIPRRRAQTVLIIVGIMLSTVIISAAFGTGDTISHSIRSEVVEMLGPIDEIIVSTRASSDDSFGSFPYIPYQRFQQLQIELAGLEEIDGLTPQIGETAPTVNTRTSLSEGRMRLAGIDPALLRGFGTFTLTSGEEALLEELAGDEVYINDKAAEELDAVAGDQLRVLVADESLLFKVKGVVNRGGLAGRDSTLLLPLERAQAIFGRAGQINLIVVSNRGDETSGADLSEEVTRKLRVLFADREVASRLKGLLNRGEVLKALGERQESLEGSPRANLSRLLNELEREELSDELISLLADEEVSFQVLEALDQAGLKAVEREADTLFTELGELRVLDVKRRGLEEADEAGSFAITFFMTMGLFSIIVGVLLIFLIFVMLAAARRSEMGMARAVGAKRHHLVQMFVFEGTAYALVSAAIGVLLGLAISALMVAIVNQFISVFDEDFQMTRHFELRSAIVAYCLGMVITFVTIAVSAYRVSHMNIVAAVRDLPAPITISTMGWREILVSPWRAFILPFGLAGRSAQALATMDPRRALTYLLEALWAALSFPVALIRSVFQVLWRPFRQGWLAFLLGLLLAWLGVASEQLAPFTIGFSLMIIGLGLMIRTLLQRTSMRTEVQDRIAYTFIGVVMLVFWLLPFDTLEGITGELNAGPEMFFVSGISVVAAAVWAVMYNADLLLRASSFIGGRIGKLRPVLVPAVAYPMNAKFRTGLTLAMFALVIFTLIIMSILTEAFGATVADVETVTGGWDIEGTVNFNTPIQDIHQAIDRSPELRIEDFEAIGGYTAIPIEARQVGAEEQRWREYTVRAADDDFLKATHHKLKLIADGYGPTDKEVWQALRGDPSLAVVEGSVVPSRSGFGGGFITSFQLEGLYYEDERMSPIDIEVREPLTGTVVQLKVIGVLDVFSNGPEKTIHHAMFISKANVDNAIPFSVPITIYRFRVAEGVNKEQVAKDLEASFREHGMETEVLEELVEEQAAANRGFNYLLTGFMGLGPGGGYRCPGSN